MVERGRVETRVRGFCEGGNRKRKCKKRRGGGEHKFHDDPIKREKGITRRAILRPTVSVGKHSKLEKGG